MIESLRAKLVAERRRNVVQEMEIRKEMGDVMIQQILESEELRRCGLGTVGPLPLATVVNTFSRPVAWRPVGRSRS